MKTFRCECGNPLFFDNTSCIRCGRDVGFCPECQQVTALIAGEAGRLNCGHPECGADLQPCINRSQGVCNECFVPDAAGAGAARLCANCRLTRVIPHLSVAGNIRKWRRLEAAKRRVLYTLRRLNFPIGDNQNGVLPHLWFDFKSSGAEPVFTGHDNGVITINIEEADDVERERARVAFGEPQRTLVGHFRHELGHYYWDVLVRESALNEFRDVFGDETDPDYAAAKDCYYQQGPPEHWPDRFVSAYASMHPWEDFAETFGAYLDMRSILETASHWSGVPLATADADSLLAAYQQTGVLVNELNREMGLPDLVPEVFGDVVSAKIRFIHELVSSALTPENDSPLAA